MPELLVANITPFTPDGQVDLTTLAAHTRWMVANGVDGFAPAGTTGGFLYLSADEKRAIHQTVIASAGSARVCPCVWDPLPGVAASLARQAEAEGAWAVFLPPPLYHVVAEDVVLRWYDHIRQAVQIPLLAYHHPKTLNPLTLPLLERLFDSVGIDGLKDSSGDIERIQALVQRWPGKVWIGGDRFLGQPPAPVVGHISGLANGWPAEAVALASGGGHRAWLLETVTALKAGGGTAITIQAVLNMGHRMPLDGVRSAGLAGVPPSDFRQWEG